LRSSSVLNFCPPKYTFTGPNKWKSLGVSQGYKGGGSRFPSPLMPMSPSSNLLHVDKHCHKAGPSSLKVSLVFSYTTLDAHYCKANSLWYYSLTATPRERKLTWITPSESKNTFAMILPADSCVLSSSMAFRELNVPIRHLHVIGFLHHTVYLTNKEFLLVSLSLSLGIWWYSAVLH
jgi:hypothetical protein